VECHNTVFNRSGPLSVHKLFTFGRVIAECVNTVLAPKSISIIRPNLRLASGEWWQTIHIGLMYHVVRTFISQLSLLLTVSMFYTQSLIQDSQAGLIWLAIMYKDSLPTTKRRHIPIPLEKPLLEVATTTLATLFSFHLELWPAISTSRIWHKEFESEPASLIYISQGASSSKAVVQTPDIQTQRHTD